MNTSENMKDILKLQPIGTDFWSRPDYKDQYGHLWKDITLGSNQPELYSVVDNAWRAGYANPKTIYHFSKGRVED